MCYQNELLASDLLVLFTEKLMLDNSVDKVLMHNEGLLLVLDNTLHVHSSLEFVLVDVLQGSPISSGAASKALL